MTGGTDVDDELPPAALSDVSLHEALLLQLDAATLTAGSDGGGGRFRIPCSEPRGDAAVANGVPTLNDKGPLLFAFCGESRSER